MTTPTTPQDTVGLFAPISYGRGYVTNNPVANPAAGSGSTIVVPGDRFYRLIAVTGTFTASAAVATRTVRLTITDADNNLLSAFPANATVAASGTVLVSATYRFAGQYTGGDGSQNLTLPNFFLQQGWKVTLSAVNLQAGDAFTGVRWVWEEFPHGNYGYPGPLLTATYPEPNP